MENSYAQEPLGHFMTGNDEAPMFSDVPDMVDLIQSSVPRAFADAYYFASGDSLPMSYQNAPIPHPPAAELAWDDFQLPQPGFVTATAPGRDSKESNDYLTQSAAYDILSMPSPPRSPSTAPEARLTLESAPHGQQSSSTPSFSIPSCPSTTTATSPDSYSQQPSAAVPQSTQKGIDEERPQPGGGGRRRRRQQQQRSASTAVENLRKRNRVAASTYRSRQRHSRDYYADRSEKLERDAHNIRIEHRMLSAELIMLRRMLAQHTDCNCTLIQRYLMSPAAAKWVDARTVQRVRDRYALMAHLHGGAQLHGGAHLHGGAQLHGGSQLHGGPQAW